MTTLKPLVHRFTSIENMIEYAIFWIASSYPEYDLCDLYKYEARPNPQVELTREVQAWKEAKDRLSKIETAFLASTDLIFKNKYELEKSIIHKKALTLTPLIQNELNRIAQKLNLIHEQVDLFPTKRTHLIHTYELLRQENLRLLEELKYYATPSESFLI